MKQALIDTDILSLFFRGNAEVVLRFGLYLDHHEKINISILTYYEILSGLKHKSATKQLELFHAFVSQSQVLPLTELSVMLSAQIYADLRSRGAPSDDIDILIAGIALSQGLVFVTHNRRHFEKISDLDIEDWSEQQT